MPRPSRADLLRHLELVRKNTNNQRPITLKKLGDTGARYRAVRGWINVGVQSLIHNPKGELIKVETGKQNQYVEFTTLVRPIRARFILFRVRDGHQTMDGFSDDAARVETTLRMGLKGGLHLFSRPGDELTLCSFHFDGHEHYGRHLDTERIIDRMRPTLREGISIANDFFLDDRTSDHTLPHAQAYEDCQLLQLTDLLVGGFRTVLGEAKNEVQASVALPLKRLAERWHEGAARMRHSRFFGGFSISQCWLEAEEWCFSDLAQQADSQMGFNYDVQVSA